MRSAQQKTISRWKTLIWPIFAAVALIASTQASAQNSYQCTNLNGVYTCSYVCANSTTVDDALQINAAISNASANATKSAQSIVQLNGVQCLLSTPILFQPFISGEAGPEWTTNQQPYPNVWLRGQLLAPTGQTTILKRASPQLSLDMIYAKGGVPSTNISITDLTLDPGSTIINFQTPTSIASGTSNFTIKSPILTAGLPANPVGTTINLADGGHNEETAIFDFSSPGSLWSLKTGQAVEPAFYSKYGGNLSSITYQGGDTYTFQLGSFTAPQFCQNSACLVAVASTTPTPQQLVTNKQIPTTDMLTLFLMGGGITVDNVNGLTVSDVTILHGGQLHLDNVSNYVINNNNFITDNDLSTFYCRGGIFIGGGMSDGYVIRNVFVNTGIQEILSGNVVVANNDIQSTDCGGINSNASAKRSILTNNIVHNSLTATTSIFRGADGSSTPITVAFDRDNDVGTPTNEAMQIWSQMSLISNNIVYANSGSGIMSGGYGSVVTGNAVYDNNLSKSYLGASAGIVVQGTSLALNSGTILTMNVSCNTLGVNVPSFTPPCIQNTNNQLNPGSQAYAVAFTQYTQNISYADNQFPSGSVGVFLPDYTATTQPVSATTLPEVTSLSATPCTLSSGSCTSTITYNTKNMKSAFFCVSNSNQGPSLVKLLGVGKSGTNTVTWINNGIYFFSLLGTANINGSDLNAQCSNNTLYGGYLVIPTNFVAP